MTYALLVPEFITVWALRQYLAARVIVRIYNSKIARRKSHDISFTVKLGWLTAFQQRTGTEISTAIRLSKGFGAE